MFVTGVDVGRCCWTSTLFVVGVVELNKARLLAIEFDAVEVVTVDVVVSEVVVGGRLGNGGGCWIMVLLTGRLVSTGWFCTTV